MPNVFATVPKPSDKTKSQRGCKIIAFHSCIFADDSGASTSSVSKIWWSAATAPLEAKGSDIPSTRRCGFTVRLALVVLATSQISQFGSFEVKKCVREQVVVSPRFGVGDFFLLCKCFFNFCRIVGGGSRSASIAS